VCAIIRRCNISPINLAAQPHNGLFEIHPENLSVICWNTLAQTLLRLILIGRAFFKFVLPVNGTALRVGNILLEQKMSSLIFVGYAIVTFCLARNNNILLSTPP